MRIPKRIQFETFYGCNARCTMCAISKPATRPIGEMDMEMFKSIVDSIELYNDHIEKVDLFGLGEPMMDKYLFERVKYLKDRKFTGLAISTNAHLLYSYKQQLLLDSGIETVIFSIDGTNKETHENIRKKVNFDKVMKNAINMIKMRDDGDYQTRFVVRFIRQKSNINEWESYRRFWELKLSAKKNDIIIVYDVNTMGGEMYSKQDLVSENDFSDEIERKPCHQVFDRMIINADGAMPLCCEDTPRASLNLGNIKDTSPLDIWNGSRFTKIREMHKKGEKNRLKICRECTMLYSESKTHTFHPKN
mgnify:FL=1